MKKIVLIFLVINLFLTSCSRKKVLIVGIAEDTSTNLKDISQSLNNGRNLAIAYLNSLKDFPYSIRLEIIDTMNNPEKTANAFRYLCDSRNASFLFGVPSVKCAQVAKHIANLREKPFITEAFDEKVIENVENVLLFNQNPYNEGKLAALYFFYILKKSRLALIYDGSNSSFVGIASGFQEIGEVGASVASESFSGNIQPIDLPAHFARLKEINPEVVFILSESTLYLKALKIAKDVLKISAIFALNDLPDSNSLLNEPVYNDVYIILPFYEKKDKFVNSHFFKTYFDRFGLEPNLYSALGYDEMIFLHEIIKGKMVSFDNSIISKLKGVKFKKEQFCTSFIGFDEKGLAMKPIDILKIVKSKITYSGEFWMDYTGL